MQTNDRPKDVVRLRSGPSFGFREKIQQCEYDQA